MKNIFRLIDACCEAFERSLPGGDFEEQANGTTFCNFAVQYVADRMGYKGLVGKNANQIFDFLSTDTEWLEIDGKVAQAHSNNGSLVVAAWKNPLGGHGHVVVIRPGELTWSANWGIAPDNPGVPKVANVGPIKRRYIGRGANWAFHDVPKYFVLKEST